MDAREEKLRELMGDASFVRELMAKPEMAEAQKLFAAHGVAFSEQEMLRLRDAVQTSAQSDGAELSDKELNGVAGGYCIPGGAKTTTAQMDSGVFISVPLLSGAGYRIDMRNQW